MIGPQGNFFTDIGVLHPASFLVTHAIELSLTAYLRFSGVKGGQSNHDLKGRLSAAEALGFAPSERFKKTVLALHDSHVSFQFRYSKDNPAAFVAPRDAIDDVAPEIQKIETYVLGEASSC